jgi:hypothetical protein
MSSAAATLSSQARIAKMDCAALEAPTIMGSQIDIVMMKKEMTTTRPKADSLTGYFRPAKYA